MEKLIITVENSETVVEVKSVSKMWTEVKKIFAEKPDAHILVNDETGKPFKDLVLVTKSNGKNWMVNAVKETNRKKPVKKPLGPDTEPGPEPETETETEPETPETDTEPAEIEAI